MKTTPFVKWAGGKGQLVDRLRDRMPETYNRYFEPFIGGGALLLDLQPQNATINDVNEQLINVYRQLQKDARAVIDALAPLEAEDCTKEKYYATRDRYNEKIKAGTLDEECAALAIWINKHCFNGLYRVNSNGLFNVPYNYKKSGKACEPDNLLAVGVYLKSVEIRNEDFETLCADVSPGDFVYFDPPYVPVSDTANFTDYTKDGFAYEDHVRLAELYKRLAGAGVCVMMSNNDVPLVHELYAGYNIKATDVKRMINSDAKKRESREVIITNYDGTD